ncbi:MAG TPA: SDR family NAD(P)-dependent oxidoreductase [Acidimicrobiia bacterium]|nr:SDR family NAD(P)-dependent oxidoreductase [Acidimicrobiia bacterium]
MPEPRCAIVTGASSGIGRAVAVEFGHHGWRVALGARRQDRLEETAAEVQAAGGAARALALDVQDPDSIAAFFGAAEAAVGPVDVLVNNAGVASPGWLHELSVEAVERDVKTNLLGPLLMSRLAVRSLRDRGAGGDLVFITSDATRHPRPRMDPYTATKAGLEALAQSLALELAGTGIRATTVRVGPTISEFGFGWPIDELTELMAYWPRFGLQRHGGFLEASAVARAVATAVTAPPGVLFDTIEVQPEAPVGDVGPAPIIERPTE